MLVPIREIKWTINNSKIKYYADVSLLRNRKTTDFFSTHKHMESAETKVNLHDVFAYFYKQDKFKQKHIQNLTWLSI